MMNIWVMDLIYVSFWQAQIDHVMVLLILYKICTIVYSFFHISVNWAMIE